MDKLFTGYYDDNGVGIYFGDALRSTHGFDVEVFNNCGMPMGRFISAQEGRVFSNIPYDLNEGKGYVVIEVNELTTGE